MVAKVYDLDVVRQIAPLDPATLDDPVGAPPLPPGDWFTPPEDMPTDAKITVDFETGRVYGRVAPRKQCLLSRPGECWTISDSPTNFRGAQQGDTVLDDGRVIRTANIGGSVRHAPDGRDGKPAASFTEAVDWYENTASRLMRVRFGADEHGIWLAGALLPHVTKRTALDVMQSPVSGDWRWRDELDDYDMSGVVLVNMPGFPLGVRARAASAWREPLIGTWDEVVAQVASLDATVIDVPAAQSDHEASPSGSCSCGGHTGQPMEDPVPRAASPGSTTEEVTEAPAFTPTETFTRDEVQEMITAAIAPLNETISQQGSVIDALAALAGDAMDATIGRADAL